MAKITIKTQAIVLQAIKYGDSSLVVKMLTKEEGIQSFMVKGVFGKKSKMKAALFQNMTLLDVVAEIGNNSLGFIKEITLSHYYKSNSTDIKKITIILFISELLSKSITESETDTLLFEYIYQSMIRLDEAISDYVNFPIEFALNLSKYLGFYPNFDTYSEGSCFNLLDGNFKKSQSDIYQIDQELSKKFYLLGTQKNFSEISLNNKERRLLLDAIITYYKLHTENIREIKSVEVLRTIF
ncbi:MAG: DNA repair protein RecO [Bacteroidales bacterium]|nr:DNA repair protein RecO [Bacteroidales bacterium]MBO5847677.1 DNA repair protein RecO [Bacteroidales bacterium]